MEDSTYSDELEMLQMMFSADELSLKGVDPHNENYELIVFHGTAMPPAEDEEPNKSTVADISVEIRIPRRGYPDHRRPLIRMDQAPNVAFGDQMEKNITASIEALDLGIPMLVLLLSSIQEEVQRVVAEIAAEMGRREASKAVDEAHRKAVEEEMASFELSAKRSHMISSRFGIRIERGEIISDRKSRFLAHIAKVSSIEEVEDVVHELASCKWLAASAHPTIYAYRFMDKEGRLSHDSEDDGEDGASKKMLFLLEQCNVLGYVLVVTRWFGGILLGPDRFKRIMECCRQALQQHKVIE